MHALCRLTGNVLRMLQLWFGPIEGWWGSAAVVSCQFIISCASPAQLGSNIEQPIHVASIVALHGLACWLFSAGACTVSLLDVTWA